MTILFYLCRSVGVHLFVSYTRVHLFFSPHPSSDTPLAFALSSLFVIQICRSTYWFIHIVRLIGSIATPWIFCSGVLLVLACSTGSVGEGQLLRQRPREPPRLQFRYRCHGLRERTFCQRLASFQNRCENYIVKFHTHE
jgi:hypothetical protein